MGVPLASPPPLSPTLQALGIRNRVLLAPMAGITDLPFRTRAWTAGAGLVISEMITSGVFLTGKIDAQLRLERGNLPLHAVQLAGNDPTLMAETARICEASGATSLDINMGCPSKRVTTGACGAALLTDLPRAQAIIQAVIGAVSIPVTLKTRLGWNDNTLTASQLAHIAENEGIRAITLHARTRAQFYTGHAAWFQAQPVKEKTNLPLIINGDIVCLASAREALKQSGADAVMVGRGAQGRPWFCGQLAHALDTNEWLASPPLTLQRDDLICQVEQMRELYGEQLGLRQARKHIGWTLERLLPEDEVKPWRAKLLQPQDWTVVKETLYDLYNHIANTQSQEAA